MKVSSLACLLIGDQEKLKPLYPQLSKVGSREKENILHVDYSGSISEAKEWLCDYKNFTEKYSLLWVHEPQTLIDKDLQALVEILQAEKKDLAILITFHQNLDRYYLEIPLWLKKYPNTFYNAILFENPECEENIRRIISYVSKEKSDENFREVSRAFLYTQKFEFLSVVDTYREKISLWIYIFKRLISHLKFELTSYEFYRLMPYQSSSADLLKKDIEFLMLPFFERLLKMDDERQKFFYSFAIPFNSASGFFDFLSHFYGISLYQGRLKKNFRNHSIKEVYYLKDIYCLFELKKLAESLSQRMPPEKNFRRRLFSIPPEENIVSIQKVIDQILSISLREKHRKNPESILNDATFEKENLKKITAGGEHLINRTLLDRDRLHQILMTLFFKNSLKIVKKQGLLTFNYSLKEFRLLRYEIIKSWMIALEDEPVKVKQYAKLLKHNIRTFEKIFTNLEVEQEFLDSMDASSLENVAITINRALPKEKKIKTRLVFAPKGFFGKLNRFLRSFAEEQQNIKEVEPEVWTQSLYELNDLCEVESDWASFPVRSTFSRKIKECEREFLGRFGNANFFLRGVRNIAVILNKKDAPGFLDQFKSIFSQWKGIIWLQDNQLDLQALRKQGLIVHFRSEFPEEDAGGNKIIWEALNAEIINAEIIIGGEVEAELRAKNEMDPALKILKEIRKFETGPLYPKYLNTRNRYLIDRSFKEIHQEEENAELFFRESLDLYRSLFAFLIIERLQLYRGNDQNLIRALFMSQRILVSCRYASDLNMFMNRMELPCNNVDFMTPEEIFAETRQGEKTIEVKEFLMEYDYYFITDWKNTTKNELIVHIGKKIHSNQVEILKINLFDFFENSGVFLARVFHVLKINENILRGHFNKENFEDFCKQTLKNEKNEEHIKISEYLKNSDPKIGVPDSFAYSYILNRIRFILATQAKRDVNM